MAISPSEMASHSQIPEPTLWATEAIKRSMERGLRGENSSLAIVGECRAALYNMPAGEYGLVLGSGPNTSAWRNRGWATLDIDATAHADFTLDANDLERTIPANSLDYVHAECIRFDPDGADGVAPARLLNQANKTLKPGGYIIIQTAHVENSPTATVPDRYQYGDLMRDHGFETVVEVSRYHTIPGDIHQQRVTYYGRKIAQDHNQS